MTLYMNVYIIFKRISRAGYIAFIGACPHNWHLEFGNARLRPLALI